MKSKNVIYLLESVDTENYTGVLKFKPEFPKNSKWTTINVKLSGLLNAFIIKNEVRGLMLGDTLVGTKFMCESTDKDYHANPFKLVEFVPTKDSTIPHNYRLELVNQTRGVKEEFTDIFQNKFEEWHNKKRMFTSKYFRRYERIETDGKLEDLDYEVVQP